MIESPEPHKSLNCKGFADTQEVSGYFGELIAHQDNGTYLDARWPC